jgi:hypothetical protein
MNRGRSSRAADSEIGSRREFILFESQFRSLVYIHDPDTNKSFLKNFCESDKWYDFEVNKGL